jgi:hypothetical protein
MTTAATEAHDVAENRLARLTTEILAPWVWVLCLPLAVAWQATEHVGQALLWGLVVGITGSVIPMVVIVRGARQGRWQSHHVTDRAGRLIPFLACITSLGTGGAVLITGNAPHQMIALAASMFATLIAALAITFGMHWKVSMHTAVSAGAVVILMTAYSPWLALLALAVVLIGWSRVSLGDHTTAQVTVGSIVGVLTGGLLYWALLHA